MAAIALAALTAAAVVAAPLIFRLFSLSPDPAVDAGQYRDVGTALARLLLVQIFFYGLMALGSSLLNARRRFFAPAWAPVLANLVIIAFLLAVPPRARRRRSRRSTMADDDAGFRLLLGLGATAGIAVMALSLVPALHPGRRAAAVPPGLAAPGGAQAADAVRRGRSATWPPTRWR